MKLRRKFTDRQQQRRIADNLRLLPRDAFHDLSRMAVSHKKRGRAAHQLPKLRKLIEVAYLRAARADCVGHAPRHVFAIIERARKASHGHIPDLVASDNDTVKAFDVLHVYERKTRHLLLECAAADPAIPVLAQNIDRMTETSPAHRIMIELPVVGHVGVLIYDKSRVVSHLRKRPPECKRLQI